MTQPRTASPSSQGSPLEGVRVLDAMRPGVVTCLAEDGVEQVAATMAVRGIHAVLISPIDGPSPSIVTDLELARAALERPAARALDMAREPVPNVTVDAPLADAVAVMCERGVAHVLATDAAGMPAGIVSSF